MRRAAFGSVIFLLAGCASQQVQPLRPLELATTPYEGIVTTAAAGSLMYEGDCLLFRDDARRLNLFPVWPDGSSFNGTMVIFHEPGKSDQRIAVAQEFLMEGRPVQWSRMPNPRMTLHRQRCGGVPFEVVRIRPAN